MTAKEQVSNLEAAYRRVSDELDGMTSLEGHMTEKCKELTAELATARGLLGEADRLLPYLLRWIGENEAIAIEGRILMARISAFGTAPAREEKCPRCKGERKEWTGIGVSAKLTDCPDCSDTDKENANV